jgi:hypothetical protein
MSRLLSAEDFLYVFQQRSLHVLFFRSQCFTQGIPLGTLVFQGYAQPLNLRGRHPLGSAMNADGILQVFRNYISRFTSVLSEPSRSAGYGHFVAAFIANIRVVHIPGLFV